MRLSLSDVRGIAAFDLALRVVRVRRCLGISCRPWHAERVTSEQPPVLLDLAAYGGDWDVAIALAAQECPRGYTDVAKKHMMGRRSIGTGFLLFGSFVSRMRGLHEGVIRELRSSNPHAVLPLIRAWVETITIGLYLLRNPNYAEYLLNGPATDDQGGRVSRPCSTPSAKMRLS